MITILNSYGLTDDFNVIKNTPTAAWRNIVTKATEERNKSRLLEDCHKKVNDVLIPKSKTKTIIDNLNSNVYIRKPLGELMSLSKNEGRCLIIARYGMLQCGKNFKCTISSQCLKCNAPDSEDHRLNVCPTFSTTNFIDNVESVPFECVFSDNVEILRKVILCINKVWDLKNGHGSMRLS